MLTPNQEMKRLNALLNGQTIDGLTLNDPGLSYQWVIQRMAHLAQLQKKEPRPLARERGDE